MKENSLVEKSKDEFLRNVANCLGRTEPLKTQPKRNEIGPPTFWKEQEYEDKKTLELFIANIEALSGRVHIAKDKKDAQNKLYDWVNELGAKLIICWDHPELASIVDADILGVHIQTWNNNKDTNTLIEIASKADIGITWADYGIGYTGTMALFSGPKQGRSVSLLPPNHIAIFKRSNLVPTMSKVIEKFNDEDTGIKKLPSSISFITGPSRTSDIEMDLSIGVHGPYKTWVIIIED